MPSLASSLRCRQLRAAFRHRRSWSEATIPPRFAVVGAKKTRAELVVRVAGTTRPDFMGWAVRATASRATSGWPRRRRRGPRG